MISVMSLTLTKGINIYRYIFIPLIFIFISQIKSLANRQNSYNIITNIYLYSTQKLITMNSASYTLKSV